MYLRERIIQALNQENARFLEERGIEASYEALTDAVMDVLREQEPVATYIGNSAVLGHVFRVEDETLPRMSPLYAAPVPSAASAVPEGWRQGVEAVAQMIQKKADDFANDYGFDDMGILSFGRGEGGERNSEYYFSLCELVEDIRAMLAVAPKPEGE